jgi:hypothetical protein
MTMVDTMSIAVRNSSAKSVCFNRNCVEEERFVDCGLPQPRDTIMAFRVGL